MDHTEKLRGLSLFTGIGGIDIALRDWVHPASYCEIDPYCQSVLLQRMQEGNMPKAPIWDDVRTITRDVLADLGAIDIIYGGFPCQDISVAGHGKGLEGERSGLFFEIVRLAEEIKPTFVFLENVPAITGRGGLRVVREITSLGYDCRWCVISAASVGALHRRERWFLLGYSEHNGLASLEKQRSSGQAVCDDEKGKDEAGESERTGDAAVLANSKGKGLQGFGRVTSGTEKTQSEFTLCSKNDGNTNSITGEQADTESISQQTKFNAWRRFTGQYWPFESRVDWQEIKSDLG